MPDKKPTDSEIKKALECCASGEVEECKNCPYVEGYPYCDGPMERDVLDLINRLQAENERLKSCVKSEDEVKSIANATIKAGIKIIKAEAYKECVKKVKEISKYETYCDNRLPAPIITYHITKDKLDNLLNELVGERSQMKSEENFKETI